MEPDSPPALDPTANVMALTEASNKRQDDLRTAGDKRQDDLRTAGDKRQDDLRAAHKEITEAKLAHVLALAEIRAEHAKELREAEAKRIDAIRAVDVTAVSVASQRASDQASVLAAQVQQSAETLRALVATTAQAASMAQQQMESTLSSRITTLEQFQYKGEGKAGVSDPAFALLLSEVKALRESGSIKTGQGTGAAATIAYISAGIGALLGLIGLGTMISNFSP